MAALGISYDGPQAVEQDREIVVEPENWHAACVFEAMRTQWRITPLGGQHASVMVRTGLDYGVLPVVAGGLGITIDGALLGALRVMEQAAAEVMAEQAKRLLKPS